MGTEQSIPVPTAATIRRIASEVYGVPSVSLNASGGRLRTVTECRHVAIWFSRTVLEMSYPELAHEFGLRDHGSALHAVRRIERMRQSPSALFSGRMAAIAGRLLEGKVSA